MLTVSALAAFLLRRCGLGARAAPLPRGFAGSSSAYSTDRHGPALTEMVKSVVPPLSYNMYKGQCGRLGVIGGCKEYTGAAPVIKIYSPELIVHPILDTTNGVEETCHWLPRLHSIVIGPGLGRDPSILSNVKAVLQKAMELNKPLVIDADGVFLLSQDPAIIKDYTRAILTPNAVEFNRLYEVVMQTKPDPSDLPACVLALSKALGHVTVVRKGPQDIISDGRNLLICSSEGSPRRCGGQGDLLSGSMGAFTYWAHKASDSSDGGGPQQDNGGNTASSQNALFRELGAPLCAAYAACLLTRECSRQAYNQHGRATMTTHMIEHVEQVFNKLFESPESLPFTSSKF